MSRSPARTPGSAVSTAGASGDHGDLTGLTDDDHTQYTRKATLTTKGDLYAATAASTPARVGVGSDGQYLAADSAQASGVTWASPRTARQVTPATQIVGMLACNHPTLEDASSNQALLGSGTILLTRLYINSAATVTNLLAWCSVLGSGLTSGQCFAGLYDSSGTLLSATADQSTAWSSGGTGLKTMALTTPQAIAADTVVYGALLTNGGTAPQFLRVGIGAFRDGALGAPFRWSAILSAQTTLPGSLTLANATTNAATVVVGLT